MTRALAFLFCGLVWGSSFYWIKVALEEIGPVTIVAYRLAFAVLGLLVVIVVFKKRPLRDVKTLVHLAVLALLTPAIPFVLTAWGETRIDSGLAALLNGTMPFLTTLIAHFVLADDRMTAPKVMGIVSGFAGILTLFSRDFGSGLFSGDGLGQLAMLLASLLYAVSSVYSRQLLRRVSPFDVTFGQMLFGDLFVWLLLPGFEGPLVLPHRFSTWFALAWMGLLGSCFTFLAYHWLVTQWGASRTSLTNYLVPAVGLALGLWLRGEQADWRLSVGAVLILSGVAIVNHKALLSPLKERRWRGRTA